MKTLSDFRAAICERIDSTYVPNIFRYSDATVNVMWREYRDGTSFDEIISKSLKHIETLTNKPLYWFVGGVYDVNLCHLYAKDKYRFCPWCNVVYLIRNGVKSCCSEICYNQNRKRGFDRLSISRKSYNSRDPVQYAEYHKISVEEAKSIIDKFVVEGSHRRPEFWIKQGYAEDEAKQKVSDAQSKVSRRSVKYWLSRGFSEADAKQKVSEIQSEYAMKFHRMVKANNTQHLFSSFNYRFWVERYGMSIEDAKARVSNISTTGRLATSLKYTKDQIRRFSKMCRESWDTDVEYEEYRNSIKTGRTASRESTKFFDAVSKYVKSSKVYYGTHEFGKYIPNFGYVRYDYVDLDNMVVIEYNGAYWHSSDASKERDAIKQQYMESLGFRYLVLTDTEVNRDRESFINLAVKFINGETNESKKC